MATIYAAALNFKGTYSALEPEMHAPPYSVPPRAPVLYIKPASCRITDGDAIPCPEGVAALRMGGTLAIVMGRAASRVSETDALGYVAGYAVANDVSIPEASFFRPAVAQRCRDGFCPIGPVVLSGQIDPRQLRLRIFVADELRCETNTTELCRSVPQLLAAITEFMTLEAGDIVLIGEPAGAPLARPGDTVRVVVEGVGSLTNTVTREVR